MPRVVSTTNGIVLDAAPYVTDVTKLSNGKYARVVSNQTAENHLKVMTKEQEEAAEAAMARAEAEDTAMAKAEEEEERTARRNRKRQEEVTGTTEVL